MAYVGPEETMVAELDRALRETVHREHAFVELIRHLVGTPEDEKVPDRAVCGLCALHYDEFLSRYVDGHLTSRKDAYPAEHPESRAANWEKLCSASLRAFFVLSESTTTHLAKLLREATHVRRQTGREATGVTIWGGPTLNFRTEPTGEITANFTLSQKANMRYTVTTPAVCPERQLLVDLGQLPSGLAPPEGLMSFAGAFWQLLLGDETTGVFEYTDDVEITIYVDAHAQVGEIHWGGGGSSVDHVVGDNDQQSAWMFVFALMALAFPPGCV